MQPYLQIPVCTHSSLKIPWEQSRVLGNFFHWRPSCLAQPTQHRECCQEQKCQAFYFCKFRNLLLLRIFGEFLPPHTHIHLIMWSHMGNNTLFQKQGPMRASDPRQSTCSLPFQLPALYQGTWNTRALRGHEQKRQLVFSPDLLFQLPHISMYTVGVTL